MAILYNEEERKRNCENKK